MLDEQGLIAHLKQKTQERWDADEQPYLISLIASDLITIGEDYRTILGEERLKPFVKRVEEAGAFRVVEHPSQLAKVGLVPADKEFEFGVEEGLAENTQLRESTNRSNTREQAVVGFLKALSRLPDSALDEVVIPTKVLVRLLSKK